MASGKKPSLFNVLLWVALSGLVLLALAVALLLTPAFQRWVFLRAAADLPGHQVEVGRFGVGPGGLTLHDLRVTGEGLALSVPEVEVEISLADLVHHRYRVPLVRVRDLTVDLRQAAPSCQQPPSAPPAQPAGKGPASPRHPFGGVLAELRELPPLWLDRLEISGQILLPEETIRFTTDLTGLAPGATGQWQIEVAGQSTAPGAPLTSWNTRGLLTLEQAASGGFTRLALDLTADASGPDLPEAQSLAVQASVTDGPEGEAYEVVVRRPGPPTDAALVHLTGRYNPTGEELAGTLDLEVASGQLAAFLAGRALPDFAVRGQASFSGNLAGSTLTIEQRLTAHLDNLGRIAPELATLGALETTAEVSLTATPDRWEIRALHARVADAAGRELLLVEALQPFALDPAGSAPALDDLSGDLLQLRVPGLPLSLLNPLLASSGTVIPAGEWRADLTVARREGAFHLVSTEPMEVRGLSLDQGGVPRLRNLDLRLSLQARQQDDGVVAVLDDLTLSSGGVNLLELQGEAEVSAPLADGSRPLRQAGTLRINLPAVAGQPFARPFRDQLPAGAREARLAWELALEGDRIRLQRADLALTGEADAGVLAAHLAQPLVVDLAHPTQLPPETAGDLLTLELQGLPPAWLTPFTGITLSGDPLRGALLVRREDAAWVVATTQPLTLRQGQADRAGQPLLRDFGLTASASLRQSGEFWELALDNLELTSQDRPAAVLRATARLRPAAPQPLVAASAEGQVDLPTLGHQPLAHALTGLAEGSLVFQAVLPSPADAAGTLDLRLEKLRGKARPEERYAASARLALAVDAAGAWNVQGPLSVQGPQGETDAALRGSVQTVGPADTRFSLDLTSRQVLVDDLQALAALFSAAAPAAPAPAAPSAAPPARTPARPASPPALPAPAGPTTPAPAARQAVWHGLTGEIQLQIGQVRAAGKTVEDIRGRVTVQPAQIAAEGLQAVFAGSPLTAGGALSFSAGQAAPYRAAAEWKMQQFDVGKFLRAGSSGARVPLTGLLNLIGRVQGSAADLARLPSRLQGRFELTGEKGTFYPFVATDQKVQTGVALVGLLGALAGDKVRELGAASELIDFFSEIPYDRISVEAVRGEDLAIQLSELLVLGKGLHFRGSGRVDWLEGRPLPEMPLQVSAAVGAKGAAANLLAKYQLLANQTDPQGYYRGPSFNVRGSLGKPNLNELYSILLKAGSALFQAPAAPATPAPGAPAGANPPAGR